jgi:hypothetical protein
MIVSTATSDERANVLALFFVAGYVGLSLPRHRPRTGAPGVQPQGDPPRFRSHRRRSHARCPPPCSLAARKRPRSLAGRPASSVTGADSQIEVRDARECRSPNETAQLAARRPSSSSSRSVDERSAVPSRHGNGHGGCPAESLCDSASTRGFYGCHQASVGAIVEETKGSGGQHE